MLRPESQATTRQVLEHIRNNQLMSLDSRVLSYLDMGEAKSGHTNIPEGEDEASREMEAMDRFLSCTAAEFWGYRTYITEQSPFSTQQGIKGSESERVLVIADDDEGTHNQFSYDKYFGIKPLSNRDHISMAAGNETQIERTRRLFYVCCTRAMTDLAVILFTADVAAAEKAVRAMNLFPKDQIFTQASMV